MGHQDRLDRRPAARGEPLVDRGEVGRPVLLADRLDHLDADDRVVVALDLAVVLAACRQVDGPASANRSLRERGLLARQGERGDRGAPPGRLDGQRAPAGADLEHPGAAVTPAWSRIASTLRSWASSRSCSAARSKRRRVAHRLVEEGREQVVAEVVVRLDVLARARPPSCAARAGSRRSTTRRSLQRRAGRSWSSARRTARAGRRGRCRGRPSSRRPCRPRRSRSWWWAEPLEEGRRADDLASRASRPAGAPGRRRRRT